MTPTPKGSVLGYCLPVMSDEGGSNGLPGALHLPQDVRVVGGTAPSMSPSL